MIVLTDVKKAVKGVADVVDLGECSLVAEPAAYPMMCVVTRESADPIGLIDTGSFYNFPQRNGRIYISASWVLRQAKALGGLDPDSVSKLEQENVELKELCKRVVKDNNEALDVLSRVEALESTGLFVRKVKTGRPLKHSRYDGLFDSTEPAADGGVDDE